MSERRYSLRACAEVCGLTMQAIRYRAIRAGFDTKNGLTAQQVKELRYPKRSHRVCESADALRKEMEEIQ